MTKLEIDTLKILLTTDPEFSKLYSEAMRSTNSIFENTPEELLTTRDQCFSKFSVKEFFAVYKIILGWCAMMGKILTKIHGAGDSDYSARRLINPPIHFGYIIYHNPSPWRVRVQLNKANNNIEIYENIVLTSFSKHDKTSPRKLFGSVYADIRFSLTDFSFYIDPAFGGEIKPNLLDSKMDITLYKEDSTKIIHRQKILVKEFSPDKLAEILWTAYNL